MARPRKDQAPDLSERVNLTVGAIERLSCPPDKAQAFMRDRDVPGLRVRVTPAGAKSFVFEAKLNRQTIRRTIGDVKSWSIEQARAEARKMAVVLDGGEDPRELERQQQADKAAQAAAQRAASVTVGEAWSRYLQERRPNWGERHYQDHLKLAQAGGAPRQRKPGEVTQPGPLAHFMPMRLTDLDATTVDAWATQHATARPTMARLALRLLKAFLRWAEADPELQHHAHASAASGRRARETLGKAGIKQDALQREQLTAWFERVRQISNPVIAAYLQCLLLTGARREELAGLHWEDVNWQWQGMSLRDKVEGERQIPLTPYVAHLLASLPRRNGWVFSSPGSQNGRLTEPSIAHRRACDAAGLEGMTLHGLRRSFKSLTEWLEVPVGIVAQIMGHKPSATAEKHYTVRPLDLLRLHHEKIEAWMLEQAGVTFQPQAVPGGLRVVA